VALPPADPRSTGDETEVFLVHDERHGLATSAKRQVYRLDA
jgi:hypothetical protein